MMSDGFREHRDGFSEAYGSACSTNAGRLGYGISMKPGFEIGIVREVTATVTEDMCPAFDGIIVHRCYSTWSLVHHMEIAARKVLVDFLEDHEEGLGAHISVDHHAPCAVGKTVRVRAELVEVRHGRVTCEVTAWDGDRLLAKGLQVQVVKNKEAIRRLIERS